MESIIKSLESAGYEVRNYNVYKNGELICSVEQNLSKEEKTESLEEFAIMMGVIKCDELIDPAELESPSEEADAQLYDHEEE